MLMLVVIIIYSSICLSLPILLVRTEILTDDEQ
jgi:hypothetical protein